MTRATFLFLPFLFATLWLPTSLSAQITKMELEPQPESLWVPLPKPDPNPNRDPSDYIWKISDKAACEKKGGVWVQRGNTGFCYLKIEPEREIDPKAGGSNGSDGNIFAADPIDRNIQLLLFLGFAPDEAMTFLFFAPSTAENDLPLKSGSKDDLSLEDAAELNRVPSDPWVRKKPGRSP